MVLAGLFPQIGLELPCSGYAVNALLKLKVLGDVRLNFKGGMTVKVEENLTTGLGGVKLRVTQFEMSDDSPVLRGVTISQADTEVTPPLSLLELIKNPPPTFRQTMFLDFTMIIEKPPGGGSPWELSSPKTAVLINDNLTQFPPQGNVYQLQAPVDFAPVNAPNEIVAQLQQFTATFTHSNSNL